MSIRFAVVHWFPLEQYPPAQNLLVHFSKQPDFSVLACSTDNDRDREPFSHAGLTIARSTFPSRNLHLMRRIFWSAWFPVFVLWRLITFRPHALLYFEPHSSFPVFLYLIFARRCQLLIHYHEYRDPSEYRHPGNRLMAIYHEFEKRFLYLRADWISQTNGDRVRMFLADNPEVAPEKMRSMSNLPPAQWKEQCSSAWPTDGEALKLVYVGAVSRRDTYIESAVDWILRSRDRAISLDLYVNNTDAETEEYLKALTDPRIRFCNGGVDYENLPEVLSKYHVGLILYRGNTRNYIFNAPNKLFEYLICGLDVWYPPTMLGVKPYARDDAWPRVIEVDFEKMGSLDLDRLRSREGLPNVPWTKSCESQLSILEAEMRKVIEAESSAVSIQ